MQTLKIEYPNKTVELMAVPRTKLKELRQLLVELQAEWINAGLGIGDLVVSEHGWSLMSQIAAMLPTADNPAVTGFDLEPLQNDFKQLEALFLAENKEISASELHNHSLITFDLNKLQASRIVALHFFSPKRILEEADELRKKRLPPPPIVLSSNPKQ